MNIDINFISGDSEDWEYYIKKGNENILDVRDYFSRIPLKNLSLDLYDKWNIDKNKMLMTNFIRFKKYGSKTIDHLAVQEKYRLLDNVIHKIFIHKRRYHFNKMFYNLLFHSLKTILYPFKFFPMRKTNTIARAIHKVFYISSKWLLNLFKLLPNTIWFIKLKKKIQNFNIIALINSKKGFSIISKIGLQYFISYYLILKELKPDMVFMYNDNWIINTSLSIACEKLDIPHYYTETSYILEYSFFDSTAIWFEGDINRRKLPKWDEDKEKKLNKRIKEYLNKYKLGVASIIGEEKKVVTMTHDKQFVLLPLQIMDDTKNIKYSPLIDNMVQLVNLVIDNTPKDYDIIIKRHPWELYKKDYLYYVSLKKILEIAEKNDRVYICHRVNPITLLKQCSALITINSTMAQENLYEARAPMVILGDTYLRGWGYSYDVNNINEFSVKLKEALNKGVTPEMEQKMKQFLYVMFFEHVVKGHYARDILVRDKQGNIIYKWEKPAFHEDIAECLHKELIKIRNRKAKHQKTIEKPLDNLRCMIDRSKLPNYKGVILDAEDEPFLLSDRVSIQE